MTDLSRRGFLTAAGAAGIAAVAGMAACTPAKQNEETGKEDKEESAVKHVENIAPVAVPEKWDFETDVVVVGAGAAGLNAAAMANYRGAKVMLLEKGHNYGGSAKYSTVAAAYGSKMQKEKAGLDFSDETQWDQWFNYLWAEQNFTVQEAIEKALILNSGKMIDWMNDELGIEWMCNHDYHTERVVAFRYHMKKKPDEFRHIGIMGYVTDALVEKIQTMGTTISGNTAVTALVKDGDAIVGVQATKDNKTIYVKGKSVILCAGGMANDLDMLQEYCPTAYERCGSTWDMYGSGECIRMGWGAGADIAGRDSFDSFDGGIPYFKRGTGPWYKFLYSGDTALARNPWLFVNDYAEQFAMLFPGDQSFWRPRILQAQPNHHAWVIFDADFETNIDTFGENGCRQPVRPTDVGLDYVRSALPTDNWMDTVNASIESGDIYKADTLEALAEKMGLEKDKFVATVKHYNECCEKGVDDLFGRDPKYLVPVLKAPFYAIETMPTLAATDCGLRTDAAMRVLDTKGNVIQGLYAAGHTGGGFSGEETTAHASTLTNVGLALTTGYIAGKNAEF